MGNVLNSESLKPTLTFRFYGVFSVHTEDGREIVPNGKRAKAILAMLILSKNGVRHRKWLQQKLWCLRSNEQSAASLRQELSSIRKHFNKFNLSLIESDRDTVRIANRYFTIRTDLRTAHTDQLEILEGLELKEPEFTKWLNDARTRITKYQQNNSLTTESGDVTTNLFEGINSISDSPTRVNQLPAIFIEPYKALDESERSRLFAEGLTEELLSFFGELLGYFVLVTDHTLLGSQPYLRIEGSVRHSDKHIRISTRLIKSTNSSCIWSKRVDYSTKCPLDIQQRVARQAIEITQSKLTEGHLASIWSDKATNVAAWEYFQRGRYHENLFRKAETLKAIELYQLAIKNDSNFIPAKVALGFCMLDSIRLNWTDQEQGHEYIREAEEIVLSTLALDTGNFYAVALKAFIENAKGRNQDAIETLSVVSNPPRIASPEILGYYGALLGYGGDLRGEYDMYKKALSLTSYPALWIRSNMALVSLLLDNGEAEDFANDVLATDSNNLRAQIFLCASLAKNEQIDKARGCAEKIRLIDENFSANNWSDRSCFTDKTMFDRICDYLKLAGL